MRRWLWGLLVLGCDPAELTTGARILIEPPIDGAVGALDGGSSGADAAAAEGDALVPDGGAGDGDLSADAAGLPPDGPPDPCPQGCGPNAHCAPAGCRCDDGHRDEGGACVPDDPCAGVRCPANAACRDGACACLPGFIDADGACVEPPQSPLEQRTEAEVCGRWRQEVVEVRPEWTAINPGDACDPGVVPADAQDNAIRRTNLYRWLAGLEPVGLDAPRVPAQQACATVLAAMGRLSHQMTPDMPCYSQAAAGAAGSSNEAGGGTLAGSVDLYVTDPGAGNAALGHRRWVLNPGMQVTAFGYKNGWSCMYSFSDGRRHEVEYVSWPPAGIVPVQAAEGRFHVSLYSGLRPGPDFRIEAGLNGPPGPVEFYALEGGFGGRVPAYGFDAPGPGVWRAGNTLTVAIRGLRDHDDVVFTSRFVDCR